MTFFSSLGSFGSSRTLSSPISCSRRVDESCQLLLGQRAHLGIAPWASSSACAISSATPLYSRYFSTSGSISDERLGLLAVFRRIVLHGGGAERRHQLLVPAFDRR